MIKQILISSLLLVSVFGTSELFTSDSNSFSIEMNANVETPENTDVVITYVTKPEAISDSYFSSVACVKVGTPELEIFANNATMIAFTFEIGCDAPCQNSSSFITSEWVGYTDIFGTFSGTVANAFATTTTVIPKYPTPAVMTSDTTAQTATFTYESTSPDNMILMGLPAQSVEGYYRCWGMIDYTTTKGYNSATIVTFSTLTLGANRTLNEPLGVVVTSDAYQSVGTAILVISALTLMN
jgi:hypothetical protein